MQQIASGIGANLNTISFCDSSFVFSTAYTGRANKTMRSYAVGPKTFIGQEEKSWCRITTWARESSEIKKYHGRDRRLTPIIILLINVDFLIGRFTTITTDCDSRGRIRRHFRIWPWSARLKSWPLPCFVFLPFYYFQLPNGCGNTWIYVNRTVDLFNNGECHLIASTMHSRNYSCRISILFYYF